MRELGAEFAEVQESPPTGPALVYRAVAEATQWIKAVHLQHSRVSGPVAANVTSLDPETWMDAEMWRVRIDTHFLLVSLRRLRRAIGLATKVDPLKEALIGRIGEFGRHTPYLSRLRNVGEHFDAYAAGKGRGTPLRSGQLQTWGMRRDHEDDVIWNWLGEEVRLAEAYAAATDLYRGFRADAERCPAALPGQEVL